MAATAEVEPTPSCSSSKEIASDCRRATGSAAGSCRLADMETTSSDSSDDADEEAEAAPRRAHAPAHAHDSAQFKPALPTPLIIELGDREVIFAIAVFLLVSVALGLLLFIGTWKEAEERVRLPAMVHPDTCISSPPPSNKGEEIPEAVCLIACTHSEEWSGPVGFALLKISSDAICKASINAPRRRNQIKRFPQKKG